MPTYNFHCDECGAETLVRLGFKEEKKHTCEACEAPMRQLIGLGNGIRRDCSTPGQVATRNKQDRTVMNAVRQARSGVKDGGFNGTFKNPARQLEQDTLDMRMFRKNELVDELKKEVKPCDTSIKSLRPSSGPSPTL